MSNEQNEKTEEATPKRRDKERDKGHIAKSQDFTASLVLTFGLGLIYAMSPSMLEKLKNMLFQALTNLNPNQIPDSDAIQILAPYLKDYAEITLLFFAFLAISAVMILRFQTGALFAKEALKPNFERLSPSSAIKSLIEKINIFKPKQMVELIKSVVKTAVVAMVGFNVIMKRKNETL